MHLLRRLVDSPSLSPIAESQSAGSGGIASLGAHVRASALDLDGLEAAEPLGGVNRLPHGERHSAQHDDGDEQSDRE